MAGQPQFLQAPDEAPHRLLLWQRPFPPPRSSSWEVDLGQLARDHKLTGGQIVSVVRHSALMAAQRGDRRIPGADLRRGIKWELAKEGRGG